MHTGGKIIEEMPAQSHKLRPKSLSLLFRFIFAKLKVLLWSKMRKSKFEILKFSVKGTFVAPEPDPKHFLHSVTGELYSVRASLISYTL